MTSDKWQRAKDIFNSALELDVAKRQEYLFTACNGDAELQQKVKELLSSYESDFLERPSGDDLRIDRLPQGTALGRYEIVRLLGAGGMGEVYLARDRQLDRKVAIKVLHEKYRTSEENLSRFVREAKAASALNHPNILTIHEIGQFESSHYIVSEFIEGKTLREILNERNLRLSEILDISSQVASALSAAHSARIVHRDVKPENLIIRNDGYVKVLDFGLAKLLPEQTPFVGLENETIRQDQTAAGFILGTVSYMSPEQAKGERIDERTDLFSLGTVIFEMVTGRTPFAGASVPEAFANLIKADPAPLATFGIDVPDELQRLVTRVLCKDPDERYQSANQLVADLKDLKEKLTASGKNSLPANHHNTTAVLGATTVDTNKQTSKRRASLAHIITGRTSVAAFAVLAALIFGTVGFYTYRGSTNSPSVQELYLKGRYYGVRENRTDNDKAIQLLEQAVGLDPNNARVHAVLAEVYAKRFFYFEPNERQWEEKSSVELGKAFALEPNLAEAHEAQGLLLWTPANHFPHEQAIAAYRRAIELDPSLDEAHHQLALIYNHIGLFDLGKVELRKTLDLNPSNTGARFRTAGPLTAEGNCEESLRIIKTVPTDFNPGLVGPAKTRVLICLGRLDEAAEEIAATLQINPGDRGGQMTSLKAILSALAGDNDRAEQEIQEAIEKGKGFGHFHHTAHNIADAYAVMNRPKEAVRYLQMAADDGLPNYPLFENDANLDRIRQSPEFTRFMADLKPQYEHYLTLQ